MGTRVTVRGVREGDGPQEKPMSLQGDPIEVDVPGELGDRLRREILGKSIARIMIQGSYIGLAMHDGSTLEAYVSVQPAGGDVKLAFDVNDEW